MAVWCGVSDVSGGNRRAFRGGQVWGYYEYEDALDFLARENLWDMSLHDIRHMNLDFEGMKAAGKLTSKNSAV